MCQNSWGIDDHPFIHVTASNFVMGFWIEPVVVQREYWLDKVKRSDQGSPVLPEWNYMKPKV